MKTNLIIMGIALTATILVGCKSSKPTPLTDTGIKELEIPCDGYDRDSKEYFTGMGIGENVNMQDARSAAFDAAKDMLVRKVGGLAKGVATSYSKTTSGNVPQDDVARMVEKEFTTQINRMLEDSEKTCERMYQTTTGTYQVHMAIRVLKQDLTKQVSEGLGSNEKLRIEYDRERFRQFVNEYLQGLENNKK